MGKVLIIEDEVFNRLLLREILEDINDELMILEAESVGSALEVLTYDLDIVFLDLNLEDNCGENLIDKIKEVSDNCKIAIISGADKTRELRHKCDWYLLKPYNDREIEDIINEVF